MTKSKHDPNREGGESGEKGYRSTLNSSGFPLQMAVEETIADSAADHSWRVLGREHPSDAGYADLIIQKRFERPVPTVVVTAVVECKKTQGPWVFPVNAVVGDAPTQELIVLGLQRRPSGISSGWSISKLDPETIPAVYCAIPSGDRRILEHWLAPLLESVGSIAAQMRSTGIPTAPGETVSLVVPVMVTTAQLVVCRVEKSGVSLDTGKLERGEFEVVPWVRFHKPLDAPMVQGDDLDTLRRKTERTVLIVNAACLTNVLRSWSFLHSRWGII